MNLQLYVYTCRNCKCIFKSPELPGESYGEFLMRNPAGDIVFVSSFRDILFQELENQFNNNSHVKDIGPLIKTKIFHKIFGLTCDPASDNNKYQIGLLPFCPKCHLNNNLSWHQTNPPELVDIELSEVTHVNWNKLTDGQKAIILNNAIELYTKDIGR
jgi:hypothetical protein